MFWAFISAGVIMLVYSGNTGASGAWHSLYALIVDFWLVAVIPVALYPFFGGKVWCRMWCPLAKYMQILSKWYGTLQISSNEKCISCTQCSTYCQVGVDVMAFAKNGQAFDNTNTSCIHCGICITVCPMDVLSFDNDARKEKGVKDAPLS
jgi:polyferredoxin